MEQQVTDSNFGGKDIPSDINRRNEMFDKTLIKVEEIHQKDKTKHNFFDIENKVNSLTGPSFYYDLSLNETNNSLKTPEKKLIKFLIDNHYLKATGNKSNQFTEYNFDYTTYNTFYNPLAKSKGGIFGNFFG